MRVAFVPRSAEIKPLFWRFVNVINISHSLTHSLYSTIEGSCPLLAFVRKYKTKSSFEFFILWSIMRGSCFPNFVSIPTGLVESEFCVTAWLQQAIFLFSHCFGLFQTACKVPTLVQKYASKVQFHTCAISQLDLILGLFSYSSAKSHQNQETRIDSKRSKWTRSTVQSAVVVQKYVQLKQRPTIVKNDSFCKLSLHSCREFIAESGSCNVHMSILSTADGRWKVNNNTVMQKWVQHRDKLTEIELESSNFTRFACFLDILVGNFSLNHDDHSYIGRP